MRANNFRCLVEPFEIANYYRCGFDVDSGHYLASDNRTAVFARLEALAIAHQAAEGRTTFICSTVWANVKAGSLPQGSGWPPLAGNPEQHAPTREALLP